MILVKDTLLLYVQPLQPPLYDLVMHVLVSHV